MASLLSVRPEAQSAVEYGLLIATIAVIVLIGLPFFGGSIRAWFDALAAHIVTHT